MSAEWVRAAAMRDRRSRADASVARWLATAVALTVAAFGFGAVDAARSSVVVTDTDIEALAALDDTLLYGRRPRPLVAGQALSWVRVVGGRPYVANLGVGHVRVSSMGRDRQGRVVAVVARPAVGEEQQAGWVLYDVARDRVRALRLRAPRRGCAIDGVGVWYRRLAYVEACARSERTTFMTTVVEPGKIRRFRDVGVSGASVVFRGRSLAVQGTRPLSGNWLVWRVLDHGRACPTPVALAVEEERIWSGLAATGLRWAVGPYDFNGHAEHVRVFDVDLSGRCQREPRPRLVGAVQPGALIRAAAFDGRWLYYATDTAVHRQRFARRGSAAPPRNDDFEDAAELSGELPLSATGVTGYATRQPGEPVEREFGRTVWYRFRAPASELLNVTPSYWAGRKLSIYTGSTLASLAEIPTTMGVTGGLRFPATAGELYSIVVAGVREVIDYGEFTLEIAPAAADPCEQTPRPPWANCPP